MADYNLIRIEELDDSTGLRENDFLIVTELTNQEYKTTKVRLGDLVSQVDTSNVQLRRAVDLIEKLRDIDVSIQDAVTQLDFNTIVVNNLVKIHDQSITQSDWTEKASTAPTFIRNKPYVPNYLGELFDLDIEDASENQLLVKRGDKWVARNIVDIPEVIRFQGFADTLTEDAPEARPGDMFIQHREDGLTVIPNSSWTGLLEYEVAEGQYIVYSTNQQWNLGGGSVDPQKQADFAQRNSLAVDFIKNKPFIPKTLTDLLDVNQPELGNDGDVLVKTGENWYPEKRVTHEYVDDKDKLYYALTKDEYTSLIDIRVTELRQADQISFNLLESKINTTEDVLRELVDSEVEKLTEYIDVNDQQIRETVQFNFNFLDNLIKGEIDERERNVDALEQADQNLSTSLENEKVFRVEGDQNLLNSLETERQARIGEDLNIREDLEELERYVDIQDVKISQRLITEINDRRDEVNELRLYTRAEVKRLDTKIDSEITNLTNYIDTKDSSLNKKIEEEKSFRIQEDVRIQTEVTTYVNEQDTAISKRLIQEIIDRRDETAALRTSVKELTEYTDSEIVRLETLIDDTATDVTDNLIDYVNRKDTIVNEKIEAEAIIRSTEDERITEELTNYIDTQDNTLAGQLIETTVELKGADKDNRDYTIEEIGRLEEKVDQQVTELSEELTSVTTELESADKDNRDHTDEEVARLEDLIAAETGGLKFKGLFNPGSPLPDLSDQTNGDYFICSEDDYSDPKLDEQCNSGDLAIVHNNAYVKLYRADYDKIYVKRDGEIHQTIQGKLDVTVETNTLDSDQTLVTKGYVDASDDTKLNISDVNYVSQPWQINSDNSVYIKVEANELRLYHVADPSNDGHAMNRGYADGRYLPTAALDPYETKEYIDEQNTETREYVDEEIANTIKTTGLNTITTQWRISSANKSFINITTNEMKLYNIAYPTANDSNDRWVANKGYVDDNTNNKLPLTGGTLTGKVTINRPDGSGEGFTIRGRNSDHEDIDMLRVYYNSDDSGAADAVNYTGRIESADNIANKGYVDNLVGNVSFQVFGVRDSNSPGFSDLPIVVEKLVELGGQKANQETLEEEIERLEEIIDAKGGGTSSSYYQDFAPIPTEEDPLLEGDFWVDSINLVQYIWTGTEWVEVGAAGESGTEGSSTFFQEDEPDSEVYQLEEGYLWIIPSSLEQYVFDSQSWQKLGEDYASNEHVSDLFDSSKEYADDLLDFSKYEELS